jgi:excinuclease ABC subunit A
VSGYTKVQAEREIEVRPDSEATRTTATAKKRSGTKAAAIEVTTRKVLDVVADRFRLTAIRSRHGWWKPLKSALKRGGGRVNVFCLQGEEPADIWKFSSGLHCPESDLRYTDPIPSMFSFNSAVGACETCRGFGRV